MPVLRFQLNTVSPQRAYGQGMLLSDWHLQTKAMQGKMSTCRAGEAAKDVRLGAPVRMGVTGAAAALVLPGVPGDPARRCPVCRL